MDERELRRVVRSAAESVYGVSAVVGSGLLNRLTAGLNLGSSGISITAGPPLSVTVDLRVPEAVPHSQVAANVAEKVRYAVQRDLGTTIDTLTVRIDGQPMATHGASTSTDQSST